MTPRMQEAEAAVVRAREAHVLVKKEMERAYADVRSLERDRADLIAQYERDRKVLEERLANAKHQPVAMRAANDEYDARAAVARAEENRDVARGLDKLEAYGFADNERVAVWEKVTPRFKPGPARWTKHYEALVQVYKRGDPCPANRTYSAPDPGNIVLRTFKKDGKPAVEVHLFGRGWAFAGQSPEEGGWSCLKVFKLDAEPQC